MRISDWSSDVCSSDLHIALARRLEASRGFDFLFFDDTSTVSNALGGSMDAELKSAVGSPRHEAMPLLPLLAKATQHIGVVCTASTTFRSKARGVGKECVSTGRSWGSPYH